MDYEDDVQSPSFQSHARPSHHREGQPVGLNAYSYHFAPILMMTRGNFKAIQLKHVKNIIPEINVQKAYFKSHLSLMFMINHLTNDICVLFLGTNIFMQKMCRHTHQWCRHNNTDSKAKCVKMLRLCRHESRVCRHELQFFRNQSTQVDTLTEQVDTLSGQVDTRPSFQNSQFEELGQQVDTLLEQVDTGPSSQNNFFIIWAVCRHHHQGRSTHYGKFSS
ncbi:hypothetical protein Taro_002391 [Colocasia esculenta]|uniref:Uncharacterized protein n=1 Tax=Colocasia esculenta TaxID=4460 RepID=A0A843TKU4_COLES|nr:hypothetical protein [Colocasia esculenta]